MSMTKRLMGLALMVPVLAAIATPAEAHRRWLLPSQTVMAGEKDVVSVDAASSNQLFVFEHRAMPLDSLVVIGPDGEAVEPVIIGSGEYRSAFDVPLTRQGTYRIALVSDGLMGFYELNGERQRWRGTEAELATAIPSGATNVQISKSSSRTETFATLGAPNETALTPTGVGLELVPITHPTDLFAGETARFKFLIDGKPASGLEVEWVAGGTRYRDEAAVNEVVADADGIVELNAETPGMYYLEAGVSEDLPEGSAINSRRSSYTAVLEFLPL